MLMEEAGKLKIYYADESGFSLEPCIPYGWQPAGEYLYSVQSTSMSELLLWAVTG